MDVYYIEKQKTIMILDVRLLDTSENLSLMCNLAFSPPLLSPVLGGIFSGKRIRTNRQPIGLIVIRN